MFRVETGDHPSIGPVCGAHPGQSYGNFWDSPDVQAATVAGIIITWYYLRTTPCE